ncbi:MAG TPA: flagellar biosynthetic protein FliR [Polyangiaceae bacterium]|nr:flagellar biosynthetic protein FliR [Polyangiaceae bacterium]
MNLGWLATEGAVFGLEAARISGVVIATPLAWSVAPDKAKIGLVLVLAIAVHGVAPAAVHADDVFATVGAVPAELLVGLAMGMVVRFAIASVQIAAEAISPMLGLGVASLFDPHTQTTETALTQILRYMAMLMAMTLGLHRVAIGAVLASFTLLPAGSVTHPSAVTQALVAASDAALSSGLRLAIPLIAVLLVIQVALAFISRAAPAMQIFSVGFAFALIGGSVTLTLALPDMAAAIVDEFSHVGPRIENVVASLTEG